eukprot:GHVH01007531.1.p1 GENE.GHVH01007531.1~~GHVH01007531.1.p1  ORF type:complete len:824 (+),score=101.39 GHVH01007531.1:1846-4317(+)
MMSSVISLLDCIESEQTFLQILGKLELLITVIETSVIDQSLTTEALAPLQSPRSVICRTFTTMVIEKSNSLPHLYRRSMLIIFVNSLIIKANWGDRGSRESGVEEDIPFWSPFLKSMLEICIQEETTEEAQMLDLQILRECFPEINRGLIAKAIPKFEDDLLELFRHKLRYLLSLTIPEDGSTLLVYRCDLPAPASRLACVLGMHDILGTVLQGDDLESHMIHLVEQIVVCAHLSSTGSVNHLVQLSVFSSLLIACGANSCLAQTSSVWREQVAAQVIRVALEMCEAPVVVDVISGCVRNVMPHWMYLIGTRLHMQQIQRTMSLCKLLSTELMAITTDGSSISFNQIPKIEIQSAIIRLHVVTYLNLLVKDMIVNWEMETPILFEAVAFPLFDKYSNQTETTDPRIPLSLFSSILENMPLSFRVPVLVPWLQRHASPSSTVMKWLMAEVDRLYQILMENPVPSAVAKSLLLNVNCDVVFHHFRHLRGRQYYRNATDNDWTAAKAFIASHVSLSHTCVTGLSDCISDCLGGLPVADTSLLYQTMIDLCIVFKSIHCLRLHFASALRHVELHTFHERLFDLSIEVILSKGFFVIPQTDREEFAVTDLGRRRLAPELYDNIVSYFYFITAIKAKKRDSHPLARLSSLQSSQIIFGLLNTLGGSLYERNSGFTWHRSIPKVSKLIDAFLNSPDVTDDQKCQTTEALSRVLPAIPFLADLDASSHFPAHMKWCLDISSKMDYCYDIDWLLSQTVFIRSIGCNVLIKEIVIGGFKSYKGQQISALIRDMWSALSLCSLNDETWTVHYLRVVESMRIPINEPHSVIIEID